MAVTAVKAVFERSRATHLRLLVLLALAEAVTEERIKVGHEWEAWPSQGKLAWQLNSSRRSIGRALDALAQSGEISDTGSARAEARWSGRSRCPSPSPSTTLRPKYEPTPKVATVAEGDEGKGEGEGSPTSFLAEPTPLRVEPTPHSGRTYVKPDH